MTPEAVAAALNTKLVLASGRRGSEVYYAEVPSSIPGFTIYQEQMWFEFRRGRLTGWNNEWQRRSLW